MQGVLKNKTHTQKNQTQTTHTQNNNPKAQKKTHTTPPIKPNKF